jgi:hypothetical protein
MLVPRWRLQPTGNKMQHSWRLVVLCHGCCRFSARMARLVCEVASNVVQEGGARVRELQR